MAGATQFQLDQQGTRLPSRGGPRLGRLAVIGYRLRGQALGFRQAPGSRRAIAGAATALLETL